MRMPEVLHLGYHYVRDDEAPGPRCTPVRLQRTIQRLKAEGYEMLTCGEVVERRQKQKSLPDRYATLSFDDGLRDHYTAAFPILQEEGVCGSFFYITAPLIGMMPPVIGFQILIAALGAERMEKEILPKIFAGTCYADLLDPTQYDLRDRKQGESEELRRIKWMFNDFVSTAFKQEKVSEMFAHYLGQGSEERYAREWFICADELTAMDDAGMEIGSHTVTHPRFNVTGVSEIAGELAHSLQHLAHEGGLSAPVTFCYPFGGHIRSSVKELVGRHYQSAWNFYNGVAEYETAMRGVIDVFDIPRLHEGYLVLPD